MRNACLWVGILCVMLGVSIHAGAQETLAAEPAKLEPAGAVADGLEGYRGPQSMPGKLAKVFRQIHGDVQRADASPEAAALPLVVAKLKAVEPFLDGQLGAILKDKKAGYYTRIYELNRDQGIIAMWVIDDIRTKHAINGMLQAALKSISTSLRSATSGQKTGNYYYWVNESANLVKRLKDVAADVREIIKSCGSASAADPKAEMKANLQVVAFYLAQQTAKGSGDYDYWVSTSYALKRQATIAAKVLTGALKKLDAKLSASAKTAIEKEIKNLNDTSDKYKQYQPGPDYWMAACGNLQRSLAGISKSLSGITSVL